MRLVWRGISVLLIVWAILGGPPAIISLITDLTDWQSLFAGPVGQWNEGIEELSFGLPIIGALPLWSLNVIYLVLLVICGLWYYWTSVAGEARRQFAAATAGTLGPITPFGTGATLADGATVASGGAGFILGNAMVQTAAYAGAAALGGLAIMTGGIALAIFGLARVGMRKDRAHRHAQEEAERLERQRYELAAANVVAFKRSEQRKIMVAVSIITAVVAINFLAQRLYGWWADLHV